jgi:hypothetical protein
MVVFPHEAIRARAPEQDIPARAPYQEIVPAPTPQDVIASRAKEPVVPPPAHGDIGPRAPAEGIMAAQPIQDIVAPEPHEHVILRGAHEHVVLRRAHQGGGSSVAGRGRHKLVGANIADAALRPKPAALIGTERSAGRIGTHRASRINSRAARDEGVGLRAPAIVRQRGLEDVRKQDPGGWMISGVARARRLPALVLGLCRPRLPGAIVV